MTNLILLILTIISFTQVTIDAQEVVYWIESPRVTNWGSWGRRQFCPPNTWVSGLSLKIEPYQESGDDTALNGIQLYCATLNGEVVANITSDEGRWGFYRRSKFCFDGFASGFQLRSERPQGKEDDFGATDFRLTFTHIDGTMSQITGGEVFTVGDWTHEQLCPKRTAICGITTQIEGYQGRGDDTALNNVDLACCKLPHPVESCKVGKRWDTIAICSRDTRNCDLNFTTGLFKYEHVPSNLLDSTRFTEKLGFNSNANYIMEVIAHKANELEIETINGKTLPNIISQTGDIHQDWSFQFICVGKVQQLVVTCGNYEINTKECRCIDDESYKIVVAVPIQIHG